MSTARRDIRWTQIPDWVITADISHATFRVYAAICRRVGKTRTAWPGIRRIASDIHASPQTVQDAIPALEKIGAVVVTRQAEKGETRSNHYWLPIIPHGQEEYQPLVQSVPLAVTEGVPATGTELEPVRTTPKNKKGAAGQRNPVWDAIVEVLGDPSDTQRGLQGRLVAELNRNSIGADEVQRIARRFAIEYGPGKLTLGALAKNWARWRDSVALAHMTDTEMNEWQDDQKRAARRRRMERSLE